jgi:hypothetical protein
MVSRHLTQVKSTKHTETKGGSKEPTPKTAKHDTSRISNRVDLTVVQLEDTDNVIGPGRNSGDGKQTDETGYETQCIKGRWD